MVFRSIGQAVEHTESVLSRYRRDGLKIVRYSPLEQQIPGFSGADAIIRFYKDPDEYKGWTGEKKQVITIAQAMKKRDPYLKFYMFEKATRGFPRKLYGYNNDDVPFWGGPLTYEELKQVLRENRVFFYTCLPPETLVFGNPEVKPISTLEVGEKVLTHSGEYRPILKKFSHQFIEDLISLKTYHGEEIEATPEHPILAIRVKECPYRPHKPNPKRSAYCHGFFYCWARDTYKHVPRCPNHAQHYKLEWVPIKNLKVEDYVALAFPAKVEDVKTIDVFSYLKETEVKSSKFKGLKKYVTENGKIRCRWGAKPIHVPQELEVTPKFMKLVGYYLSEGSRGKYLIKFSFNKNEHTYIQDVCQLVKKIFGLKSAIVEKENIANIQVNSSILSQLFGNLFGDQANEKHLPKWMLFLPLEKQMELVTGLVNGDGHRGRRATQYTTASIQLAYQLRQILLRLGIVNSISHCNPRICGTIDKRKIVQKTMIYEIRWSNNKPKFAMIKGNLLLVRIKEKLKKHYDGYVYNLEVDTDNSYTTVGGTLHNCTWPAPYTMAFMEAWITGTPVVTIGPALADNPGWAHFNIEVPSFIQNGVNGFKSDSLIELRKYVSMLLEDYDLAKKISQEGRKSAIELFDKGKIKRQWKEFFDGLEKK